MGVQARLLFDTAPELRRSLIACLLWFNTKTHRRGTGINQNSQFINIKIYNKIQIREAALYFGNKSIFVFKKRREKVSRPLFKSCKEGRGEGRGMSYQDQ